MHNLIQKIYKDQNLSNSKHESQILSLSESNQKNETENKLEKAKTAKTNKPSIQANKRKPNQTKPKQNDKK